MSKCSSTKQPSLFPTWGGTWKVLPSGWASWNGGGCGCWISVRERRRNRYSYRRKRQTMTLLFSVITPACMCFRARTCSSRMDRSHSTTLNSRAWPRASHSGTRYWGVLWTASAWLLPKYLPGHIPSHRIVARVVAWTWTWAVTRSKQRHISVRFTSPESSVQNLLRVGHS